MAELGSLVRKAFAAKAEPAGARLFRFVISTGDEDLQHDRIDPDGWDLEGYRANPVVLWGHDHSQRAIGRTTEIGVVGGKLKATVGFPPPEIYHVQEALKTGLTFGAANPRSSQ